MPAEQTGRWWLDRAYKSNAPAEQRAATKDASASATVRALTHTARRGNGLTLAPGMPTPYAGHGAREKCSPTTTTTSSLHRAPTPNSSFFRALPPTLASPTEEPDKCLSVAGQRGPLLINGAPSQRGRMLLHARRARETPRSIGLLGLKRSVASAARLSLFCPSRRPDDHSSIRLGSE